jgi:hypothetical protein
VWFSGKRSSELFDFDLWVATMTAERSDEGKSSFLRPSANGLRADVHQASDIGGSDVAVVHQDAPP